MSTITELCTTPPDASPELEYSQLLENLTALNTLTTDTANVTPAEAETLLQWLPAAMMPTEALLPPEHVLEDDDVTPPAVLAPYQAVCHLALQIIARLAPADISTDLAVALIAQTSAHDPWTTAPSRALSTSLLDQHTFPASTLTTLLTALKPHFTAPHPTLTPLAHAAVRQSTFRAPLLPPTPPSYRSTHPATPTLLHWVTLHLPPSHLEPSWHLIVPPTLTLLDDTHAPTKARGAHVLSALLLHPQTPAMLVRTGLAPVLWDAALPCVLSLPPLTPTAVSVPLLTAGYDALVALARVMGAGKARERARLLGVLLRRGVLAGMRYAGEVVAVAEVLVGVVGVLVGEMGVWCVRHLGEVVGVLVGVLVDPFVGVRWGLAVGAVRALVEVVRVGWSRVGGYVWEVVRACVVCWRRVVEDGGWGEGGETVMAELRRCVGVVAAVVERGEWEGMVKEVVAVEKSAVGLFEGTVEQMRS
ncbi:uncharacterized protein H6S33_010412 [Morchella sextelata]|uniref:uncharacterized protein n=1 Tax=Morchella sextelata TaxID=1174677 RepID=UPI001D055A27|nr:uncharacterized protein H6S33_010412 [Morchella sextelata]KAH0612360.1 hypothetical protein H6S33_010412 [Morchella sextelata]